MPGSFPNATTIIDIGGSIPVLQSCNGSSISIFIYVTGFQPSSGSNTAIGYSTGGGGIFSRISLLIEPGSLNIYSDGTALDGGSPVIQNSGFVVPLNEWSHIVTVNDYLNSRQKIFLNGTSISGPAAFGSPLTSATTVGNAAMPGEDNLSGSSVFCRIHDARLYNRALSDAEILTIYNSLGTDDIVFGLQARWELSELPSGTITTTTVKDTSVTKWPIRNVLGSPTYVTGILRIP